MAGDNKEEVLIYLGEVLSHSSTQITRRYIGLKQEHILQMEKTNATNVRPELIPLKVLHNVQNVMSEHIQEKVQNHAQNVQQEQVQQKVLQNVLLAQQGHIPR
jgi:hypothetical protein